ncbi:hypothetical protein DY000_02015431 [Brassica cretica]|uniref:SNARE-interacting protein KEULE n=1 Tax=Brassica cretica TaxID=69181 RepID=A0ABQ7CNQ2_BRACR|nr:hypothetical protein DY000_02015431 [Brassica cretica]
MSFSDSGSYSNGGDHKSFRQITRERLLYEMLMPEKNGTPISVWKVLILDKFTVKVMSSVAKMSEISQQGISLAEVITRQRQPMTSFDAIYFIQPTESNVNAFLSDMTGKSPLYKKAFVFFSSPVSRSLVTLIRKDMRAMKRISALKEMNLEYISMDIQGFVTNNENALEDLYSDEENHQRADYCLNVVAKRIATVLASLKEYPFVRYRGAKALDATTMTTYRELIPTKLAADSGDISSKDLKKVVHALPQYSEQIDKLSLHVEIARTINSTIMEQGLRELGKLEQDLVFGDAGRKDVIKFLSTNNVINQESKLRLMMILAAIYPKKFEGEKGRKMMELAKLSGDDVVAVNNLRLLGPVHTESKRSTTGSFSLKFDVLKKKRAARKDRVGETQTWQLSRFYPIVEELVEKLNKGHLPKQDYPCMNEPKPTFYSASQSPSASPVLPHSRRTPTWARRHLSEDGYFSDSVLGRASSGFKKKGQRIFVFIVGGATRSELRVCHKLTEKLDREVILGSSSFLDPQTFLTKMKQINEEEEISLDDIDI